MMCFESHSERQSAAVLANGGLTNDAEVRDGPQD